MRFLLSVVVVVIFSHLLSCKRNHQRFNMLSAERTGIEFNNIINDSDTFNILTYEYIYNGGGIAVADFNNDGLLDVYFTGNVVDNALYLNEGDFRFKDVTKESGTTGDNKWCSGVAVVDINGDGWQDIYVCATTFSDPERRKNILYINQGVNSNGIPTFIDYADVYNVNDSSYTTHAAFFDYDNDGDLDLFLINNKMTDGTVANVFRGKEQAVERVDKLLRNDWSEEKNHPVFTDVSKEAGIIYEGYSLGVNITDINQDGWSDIYVANDYLSNDLIYINQKDGTFKDLSREYVKHTSHSAMGCDIVDINNDGMPDIIVVDMLPEDNYRKKTMLGPTSYTTYINNERYGYQYQYVRNTLQLNQGPDPVTKHPVFSEIAFLAGVSSTDWSWTPLVADFDNDGYRDIVITNGFPRDVTDRDFIEYNNQSGNYASKGFLLTFIPTVKIKNYAFRNTGGFVFEDVTDTWGITTPSFSNGAVYADLDNDGDLDYIVNNINDKASIFKNLSNQNKQQENNNWLRIKLKGTKENTIGLGAKVYVYHSNGNSIYSDHSIYRGYLSSVEPDLHFGLGNVTHIDSIIVEWPGDMLSRLTTVKSNQVISIDIADSKKETRSPVNNNPPLFKDVSDIFSSYFHEERDFIDFNIQPLLLHKLSQYGPGVAVGDVNGDGLDDLYIGGSHNIKGTFFLQNEDGTFRKADLIQGESADKNEEELGVLLFDADNDGDLDLYCVSGGYEYGLSDQRYKHIFLENIGGVFRANDTAIPEFLLSGSCVRAADYDRDGDLDLFVGGRVLPHQYPTPVNSYLLRNDSDKNGIKFSIVNTTDAPGLTEIGMVCDALWTDFDNDGWVDLMLAGEWMSPRFFKNNEGKLDDITGSTGIGDATGWWNSIAAADFDNDGDIDYVVGNLGLNTLNRASSDTPVSIYFSDFDKNEGFDMISTVYYKNPKGVKEEFPYFGRLDVQKEMIKVKLKFLKHAEFGVATINDVLTEQQLSAAMIYRANYFESAYIENKGSGKFTIKPLPIEAQLAPVFGIVAKDVNNDGNTDVVMVGNDFGTELLMGRADAFNGLVLAGDGKGEFKPLTMRESGIAVKGDAKALTSLMTKDQNLILISTQNRGPIKAYEQRQSCSTMLNIPGNVCRIEILLQDKKKIIKEAYHGNGFISQSTRKLCVPLNALEVTLVAYDGERKVVAID